MMNARAKALAALAALAGVVLSGGVVALGLVDVVVPGEVVAHGGNSGVEDRQVVVVRDQAEYDAFRRTHPNATLDFAFVDWADGALVIALHGFHPDNCARAPAMVVLGEHVWVNFDEADGRGFCGSMVTTPWKAIQVGDQDAIIVHTRTA